MAASSRQRRRASPSMGSGFGLLDATGRSTRRSQTIREGDAGRSELENSSRMSRGCGAGRDEEQTHGQKSEAGGPGQRENHLPQRFLHVLPRLTGGCLMERNDPSCKNGFAGHHKADDRDHKVKH